MEIIAESSVVSEDLGYSEEIISPIISAGDAIGSVILLQKEEQKHFGAAEKRERGGSKGEKRTPKNSIPEYREGVVQRGKRETL